MSLSAAQRVVKELSTFKYGCTLHDETGEPIDGASLESLTLTLYDRATMAIINGRDHVNALNANGVTVSSSGELVWICEPEDNPIISTTLPLGETEEHTALFQWRWDSGSRAGKHELHLLVTNLGRVPASDLSNPLGPGAPVADHITNLKSSKANLSRILVEITAKPKPTYSLGGQSFSWESYQRFLLDAIERIDDLIDSEDEPFEITSRGYI